MDFSDPVHTFEVGKRTGSAQDPVVTPRGQARLVDRLAQHGAARLVGRRDLFQQFTVGLGVSPNDARAGWLGVGEARGADLGDLDLEIDAVEQRARNLCLVVCSAARRSRTRPRRVVEIATAARVHRGDELIPRGVIHRGVGVRHHDRPGLERLVQ